MQKQREIRDILVGREYQDKMNNKKTAWTKIGTMFVGINDDGSLGNISLMLDAYPAHGQNPVAFPPKPKDENGRWQNDGSQSAQQEEVPTINLDEEEGSVRFEGEE